MDISNHRPYQENTRYKTATDLTDFIIRYYSPLHFTIGWLLEQAAQASRPDDPFVLLYKIKWFMKVSDREQLIEALEKVVDLQPDFVPLLRLAGEYYELVGEMGKAAEIYAHILELYPGEPLWVIYKKKIIQYNEAKVAQ